MQTIQSVILCACVMKVDLSIFQRISPGNLLPSYPHLTIESMTKTKNDVYIYSGVSIKKKSCSESSQTVKSYVADTCLYIVYIEFLYPCGLVLAWFIQCRRRRIVGWRVFFCTCSFNSAVRGARGLCSVCGWCLDGRALRCAAFEFKQGCHLALAS